MKQNSHLCFIRFLLFDLLLLLLLISSTSARPLLAKQVEGEVKANELTKAAASSTETKEEFSDVKKATLMGSEECDVKDEGCLQRRMVADAHLDYIYTQHNKP